MVASKKLSADLSPEDYIEAQKFKEMIKEGALLFSALDIGYYLPFLKWIDPHGIESSMKNLQKKREVFMKKLVQDHRETRVVRSRDLMDVLISAVDNHEIPSDNNDDVMKANAVVSFFYHF